MRTAATTSCTGFEVRWLAAIFGALLLLAAGCQRGQGSGPGGESGRGGEGGGGGGVGGAVVGGGVSVLRAPVSLSTVAELDVIGDRIVARGARQEWNEALIVPTGNNPRGETLLKWPTLTWQPPDGSVPGEAMRAVGAPGAWSVRAYRVEEVAVDSGSVAVVRQVGPGSRRRLPLVLVPLAGSAEAGFRVPPGRAGGTGGSGGAGGMGGTLVYIEWRAPLAAEPGRWVGTLEATGGGMPARRAQLELTVDDLALSDSPPMALYGEIDWSRLTEVFPREFASLEARFLSREDPACAAAVERLDQMVRLARRNRVEVGFSRLQPTVKNTPREGVRFDWTEYDSLVVPWLRGELEGMGSPAVIGLPRADALLSGAVRPEEYWASVVSHFDQLRLLGQVVRPQEVGESLLGPVGAERVRVGVQPAAGDLGLSLEGYRQAVWSAAGQAASRSDRVVWLEARAGTRSLSEGGIGPGLLGAWFFPGAAFGSDEVVPGMALKWARRAQQDWELIDLARRRGATRVALTVAQRMSRTGAMRPEVAGDLLVPMMSREVWEEGLRIVRDAAVSRDSSKVPSEDELSAREFAEEEAVRRWTSSADRPLIWVTSTEYGTPREGGVVPVSVVAEFAEPGTAVQVISVPDGWAGVSEQTGPERVVLRGLVEPGRTRFPIDRSVDEKGRPLPPMGTLDLEAVAGPDRLRTRRESVIPAMRVARADGETTLDGSLTDWTQAERVADGAWVRMLDRAGLQGSDLRRSANSTQVLMRWEPETLYLAFRADGLPGGAVSPGAAGVTNFVREELGRAFGEDLLRVVLRTPERELRLLVKPSGVTVEEVRDLSARGATGGAAGGAAAGAGGAGGGGVRYAGRIEPGATGTGIWRAEIAIPASLLQSGALEAESALQMNVVRHDAATGESSSWAGPIDRDYQDFRGLLMLVESVTTGGKPAGRSR